MCFIYNVKTILFNGFDDPYNSNNKRSLYKDLFYYYYYNDR